MIRISTSINVCACVVVLFVLTLMALQYYLKYQHLDTFAIDVDYTETNYRIARGDRSIQESLVWNKDAYIDAPLIVPSLKALRFRDTKKNVHEMVEKTKNNIVQTCAKERANDNKDVNDTLSVVNTMIRRSEIVEMLATFRANHMKQQYENLVATVAGSNGHEPLKELLVMDCLMTADNFLLGDVYFDDTILTVIGDEKDWESPKSFKISNFRNGKVFACKCGDMEQDEYDETTDHSKEAGLIVKSEFPKWFSTSHDEEAILANWRVYHSSHKRDDPKAQGNVKWYEKNYDDSGSEWGPAVFSTSGFRLNYSDKYIDTTGEFRSKPADIIMKEEWQRTDVNNDNAWKIWAGKNRNKYVWFRYKERRY